MSNLRAGSLEDEAVTVIASVEAARERAAGAAGWASRRRRAGLGHGGLGVASVHRRLETLCGRSSALRSRSRVLSERLYRRRGAKRLQAAVAQIQAAKLRFPCPAGETVLFMQAVAEGRRTFRAQARAPRGTAPVPMQPPMRPALARRRDRRVAARAHRRRAGRRFRRPRISTGENLCHGFFGVVSGAFRAVFWSIRGVSGCSNGLSRRAAPNRPPPRARGRHLPRRSFSSTLRRRDTVTAAAGQCRIDSFGFAPCFEDSAAPARDAVRLVAHSGICLRPSVGASGALYGTASARVHRRGHRPNIARSRHLTLEKA